VTDEGASNAEAEQTVVEGEDGESEEDYNILIPTKPSHLDFEKSTMTKDDMPMMMKLGYFGEAESKFIRFAGEETIPEPKKDEVIIFKSFFRVRLRFPLNEMIGVVLKKFEAFRRVHELHYQTKARADGLHENFGCYNFAYRKDTKAPVLSYCTKWPTGWKNEWFYMKADEKNRENLMTMVMSPLSLSFGMTRPLCNMQLGHPISWPK
jgi:hypothetical protein